MQNRRSLFRWLAYGYAALAGLPMVWAWWVDIRLLHSGHEHLMPDVLLAFLGLPSSLAGAWLYAQWPASFSGLWQTAYLSACVCLQAGLLYAMARFVEKRAARSSP